jgi:hypothetical protein
VTRTILRGTNLVLSAERAQGAPDGIYCVECMTCLATSGRVDSDINPVARWAILHTEQQGPDHGQFLMSVERHWRVDRVRTPNRNGTPARSADRVSIVQQMPPTHRAPRRLDAYRRRAVGWLGRFAGPLVLAAFIVVAGLSGYLIGCG